MTAIRRIHAREIIDSRGDPTVEVDVETDAGARGRAAVPSGASTGAFEARDLRDGGAAWHGRGVSRAVEHVNGEIAGAVRGLDVADLAGLDRALERLDGTAGLHRLGANAVLGVSLAGARAAAAEAGVPLWQLLGGPDAVTLPVPLFNLLNGGRHADNRVPVQEFIVVPAGVASFSDALRLGSETRAALGHLLHARGMPTSVGDEGGFAPHLTSPDEGLELLLAAIEAAGHEPGRDAWLALDCAATELQDSGGYLLDGDEPVSSEEAIGLWADLCQRYPVVALEDPLGEDDWEGWRRLGQRLGDAVRLVGDDLFVTHPHRLAEGIRLRLATAVIVKPNQAGTLTRTLDVVALAHANGLATVMSHRSGETEDTIIADLAVAAGTAGLKAGAPCRSERLAKYNQLLRIEEALGDQARYAGRRLLTRSSCEPSAR
jgi:enolase